jgi:hypothetical protein
MMSTTAPEWVNSVLLILNRKESSGCGIKATQIHIRMLRVVSIGDYCEVRHEDDTNSRGKNKFHGDGADVNAINF